MVVVVFGFWFGFQLVLRSQYPALAVVSTSMLPTLNVGDVIIVQGVPASEIKADYLTGDIVVFKSQTPDYRIVHRAIKIENRTNGYWITTKGDNNLGPDAPFHESQLIGKVVARVPYIGNFALFINALGSFYYFIIILIIIVNILLSLAPSGDEKKKTREETLGEKKRLFGKLTLETLFLIILNVLFIGFLVFSLYGSFTFWQIGADPPQYVTIRGMYSDLQYQANYGANVTAAFLSQGFMTYQIDCLINGSVRIGVPTFSWVQVTILVLLLFDFWIFAKFLHLDKKIVHMLKRNSA